MINWREKRNGDRTIISMETVITKATLLVIYDDYNNHKETRQ